MGSEQKSRTGIDRVGEGGQAPPEAYTIVGVDISAEDLKGRYKGTRREAFVCSIIDAAVQRQRTKGPPPAGFVNTLRGGVNTPILVCDLNRDGTKDAKDEEGKKCGRNWVIVIEGRQRTMGLRQINAENTGAPKLGLRCIYQSFPSEGAGLAAALVKIASGARVARTFSQRAEDATDLDNRSVAHADIAPLVEARDEEEVKMLLCLAKCIPEVQESVDAGVTPLALCKVLCAQSETEQARRVARKTSGGAGNAAPTRGQQDAAAPPRPKARPAVIAAGVARELTALAKDSPEISPEILAIVDWFSGNDSALAKFPVLLKAAESAGWSAGAPKSEKSEKAPRAPKADAEKGTPGRKPSEWTTICRETARAFVLGRKGAQSTIAEITAHIQKRHPETPNGTVRGAVWDLDVRFPEQIVKPGRGLFAPKEAT